MTTRQKTFSEQANEEAGSNRIDFAEAILIAIIVVTVAACARVASSSMSTAAPTPAVQATNVETAEAFEYFPRAYVIQATEIPEHIQAF
jgi:hypothetical protein